MVEVTYRIKMDMRKQDSDLIQRHNAQETPYAKQTPLPPDHSESNPQFHVQEKSSLPEKLR